MSKVMRRGAAVVVLVITLLAMAPGAAESIDIRVWPATSMAPTIFTVRVFVERHPANRWIKVTAESEGYFGSSEGQLEGERSSRLRIVQFRDVPAGTYEVQAVVLDGDGDVIATGHTTAMVIGR